MQIIDCVQGSPEWFEARCGIPTASGFDKIVTSIGAPSKQKKQYLYKLAGEALSGVIEESYQNATMQRGTLMESEARDMYSLISDLEVSEVGFCRKDGYGASPDGLVGLDGCLEIKCPLVATHVGYLFDNKLPTKYIQQVQGQLLVTGRKWCDFVSYFPNLKPLIVRVQRDEQFILTLKTELEKFCIELKEVINEIK